MEYEIFRKHHRVGLVASKQCLYWMGFWWGWFGLITSAFLEFWLQPCFSVSAAESHTRGLKHTAWKHLLLPLQEKRKSAERTTLLKSLDSVAWKYSHTNLFVIIKMKRCGRCGLNHTNQQDHFISSVTPSISHSATKQPVTSSLSLFLEFTKIPLDHFWRLISQHNEELYERLKKPEVRTGLFGLGLRLSHCFLNIVVQT